MKTFCWESWYLWLGNYDFDFEAICEKLKSRNISGYQFCTLIKDEDHSTNNNQNLITNI